MGKKIEGVKGMQDLVDARQVKIWQHIERRARAIFEPAGFQEIRTPLVEDVALFERGVGEATEIVEKEMYTLTDRNDKLLALRPEGTASVVRAFVEHFAGHQQNEGRFYYFGPMYRYERMQKGRLRQFHQIGIEVFGADHPILDAEVMGLGQQFFSDLGIAGLSLQINSLGSKACREKYIAALRAFLEGVREQLCTDCQRRIERNPLRVLDCKKESCGVVLQNAPLLPDYLSEESRSHFAQVQSALQLQDIPFQLNPRLVRGLDYYEKTVFEFVSGELGAQNTLCAGGRYNDLVHDLGGPSIPAVGFALGMERLVSLIPEERSQGYEAPRVYMIGLDDAASRDLFPQLKGLRESGVVAELDFGGGSLKNKLKRADRWQAQWAIIYGEDERKKGVVIVRSMGDGTQEEIPFDELFMRLFSKLPTLMHIGGR